MSDLGVARAAAVTVELRATTTEEQRQFTALVD
jgi:hypothetical protein